MPFARPGPTWPTSSTRGDSPLGGDGRPVRRRLLPSHGLRRELPASGSTTPDPELRCQHRVSHPRARFPTTGVLLARWPGLTHARPAHRPLLRLPGDDPLMSVTPYVPAPV